MMFFVAPLDHAKNGLLGYIPVARALIGVLVRFLPAKMRLINFDET